MNIGNKEVKKILDQTNKRKKGWETNVRKQERQFERKKEEEKESHDITEEEPI